MAKKIRECRDRRYHVTSSKTVVHPPDPGASKDELREIASQVATTKPYDAAKVVGRH
jgi:hypothetical protein